MRTLNLDAGNEETAFLFFDTVTEKIGRFGKIPNDEIVTLIKDLAPGEIEALVIEFPYPRGMPTSYEEFLMVEWIGRFRQVAEEKGIPVEKIWRMREKMAICGVASAADKNIRAALIDRFGPRGTKKSPGPTYGIADDVWSALAVAATFADEGASDKRKEALQKAA